MAGIIVGSVGVSVTPDVTGFAEKLRAPLLKVADQIGAQVGQIIGDRIAGAMPGAGESAGTRFSDTFKARVDAALASLPDASVNLNDAAAQAKLEELRTRLSALSASVGVEIDPTEAYAALTSIRGELDALGARSPKIDVQVDIAKASAELAAVTAEVDALAGSGGGSGGSGVRGLAAASGDASRGFSNLTTAGLVLGPAVVPVLGAVGAGLLGVVSGLAAAGSGALAFGALAIPTLKDIKTDGGPAAAALAGLTSEWDGLVAALKPQVLADATSALQLASRILPDIAPLAQAAGAGFAELTADAAGFEPAIASISTAVSKFTAGSIVDLGHLLLGAGVAFGNVIVAALPLAEQVLPALDRAIDHLDQTTASLGQSKDFQGFLAYVQDNGPRVVAVVEDLFTAGDHLVKALAPIGTVVLVGLEGVLDILNRIPVPLITAAATAVAALAVSLKAVSLYSKLGDSLGKLGAAAVPIGIAGLAVGVLGSYVFSAYEKTQQADQATKAYFRTLATLDPSKFASISDLNLGLQAQQQALQAVIDKYEAYKASLKATPNFSGGAEFQLAALKSAAGQAQAALDKLNGSSDQTAATVAALAAEFGISQDRVLSLAQSNNVDLTGSLSIVQVAFGAVYTATKNANSATGQLSAQQKILADTSQTAAAKADALTGILDLMAGDSISATEAQNNLTISIQNDATAFDAHSRSLNANTAAGAANQNVLLQQIQMAEQTAEAQAKAGGTLDAVSTQYGANTAAIAANAIKNGANAAEVQNLIGKYQQLPPQVTTLIHADTGPARSAVASFAQQLPQSMNAVAYAAGVDTANALGSGIRAGAYAAALAASYLAQGVMDAINRKLDRHSPPKEIIKIGQDIGPALAVGITSGFVPVSAAAQQLAGSIGAAISGATGGFGLSLPSVTAPFPTMSASSAALTYNGMGSLQTLPSVATPGFGWSVDASRSAELLAEQNVLLRQLVKIANAQPAATGAATGHAVAATLNGVAAGAMTAARGMRRT